MFKYLEKKQIFLDQGLIIMSLNWINMGLQCQNRKEGLLEKQMLEILVLVLTILGVTDYVFFDIFNCKRWVVWKTQIWRFKKKRPWPK